MQNKIKEQLKLSLPSAFECITMSLISMVDVFFVSLLGSKSLSAIGAMASIIQFLNLVTKSIQVSNDAIISRELGEGNIETVKLSSGNAVILVTIFQLLCNLIILSIGKYLPSIFKVDRICISYLYIRLIGSIFASISSVIIGHERSRGKPNGPLFVRILSLFLNIIFDYIAIKFNYGVNGVAVATVIIEFINLVLILIISKGSIKYKYNKDSMKNLLLLAKHGILDRIFDRGAKLVLDIILSRLGTFEYAAHVIINQIESFVNDFCYGFCIGITTNIGMYLGKNVKEETKSLKIIINKLVISLSIIISLLTLISSIILLPILLRDKQALIIGYKLIPFLVIYSSLMPIRYKNSSILSAMKEFEFIAKISLFVNTLKIILAFFLSRFLSVYGVWTTFIIYYLMLIYILNKKIKKSFIV